MFDIIIKNGRIVDGTSNPWFFGDVGIKEGKIVQIGRLEQECKEVIDAGGQIIAPGFIDGHCHSDLMVLRDPLNDIKIQQGVTTEVVGNCGIAPSPLTTSNLHLLKSYVEPILGTTSFEWSWRSVPEYMEQICQTHPLHHVATYVAHGALRIAVMGFENRPATRKEMDRMKALLEEGLKAGAIGLSIGLLYAPGSYTSKEELAELCKVLPKYGGLLATHIRGEGRHLIESLKEVIWVAEKSGVSLHVSHLKAAGKSNWGKVEQALEIIEDCRAKGMDITCDVYPYTAGSTSLTTLLPPWVLEGGVEAALERLKDPSQRKRIKEELKREAEDWDNLVCSTGWENVYLSSLTFKKSLEGKNLKEVSDIEGKDPADCVIDLLIEENGNISIVFFHMSEKDVEQVIRWDKSLIASDSLGCESGKAHPRLYGTFPRVFSEYVRNKGLLSLEEAVRKVTSFPAQRFKLGKKGMIIPGYDADLVVFDPQTIQDQATYQEPSKKPNGISYVIVNGRITLKQKKWSGNREGHLIKAVR